MTNSSIAEFDCVFDNTYIGVVSHSLSGARCMRWEEATEIQGIDYLHNIDFFKADSWDSVGNKCRLEYKSGNKE